MVTSRVVALRTQEGRVHVGGLSIEEMGAGRQQTPGEHCCYRLAWSVGFDV